MANTVRTVSELLDIFADNTSQDISPQDMRDFVVSTKLDDTVVLDDLADVAFTGSYNDLTDLPVITVTASRAVVSDVSGELTAATTTATEIGYVNGVTSAIQTQLNAKQATITGGATSITSSDLTASRALASDGSGKVAVSTVTSTELGYVSGVTSAIQTQISAKPSVYRTSFTNPSTDTLTVTHSLGNKYVQVTVYDENDLQILVDEVTATSTSVITLDKTSYGTVTGTWNVVVVG